MIAEGIALYLLSKALFGKKRGGTKPPWPTKPAPGASPLSPSVPVSPSSGPAPKVIIVPPGRGPAVVSVPGEGTAERQTMTAALAAREKLPFDRSYWRPVQKLKASDIATAQSLLPQWRQGGVWFKGEPTWTTRRQFRAVKHGTKRAIEAWEPAPPFS